MRNQLSDLYQAVINIFIAPRGLEKDIFLTKEDGVRYNLSARVREFRAAQQYVRDEKAAYTM